MSTTSLESLRHVLIIGSDIRRDAEVYRQLAPLQRSWDLELHRVPTRDDAVKLINSTSFDLLVIGHDLVEPSAAELVHAVRGRESACRHSAVLVVADRPPVAEVEDLVGRGVNRVIPLAASGAEVQQVLSQLLNVAPRLAIAAPLRYRDRNGEDEDFVVGTIDNLSISGMLVEGAGGSGVGARLDFEIDFPGQPEPIKGVAEVVREAGADGGSGPGFAARFLAFHGVGRQRLEAFILERAGKS
jgi:hypothetical protein